MDSSSEKESEQHHDRLVCSEVPTCYNSKIDRFQNDVTVGPGELPHKLTICPQYLLYACREPESLTRNPGEL